jgi:integrase
LVSLRHYGAEGELSRERLKSAFSTAATVLSRAVGHGKSPWRLNRDQIREIEAIEAAALALVTAMRTLRAGLRPWLGLPAAEFGKADLRVARDVIVERGALMQSNRLLGYLGPVLRWAAQEDLIPTNFVPDLRKAPERKRDRVLSSSELAAIWHACDLSAGPVSQAFGRMVRFLLVTAQRRDEAASLRHGDIVRGVWKQADNKIEPPAYPPPPRARAQSRRPGRDASARFRWRQWQDQRILKA